MAKCVSDGSPNCSMPNRPALGARIILSMKLRANSLLAAQSEVVMDVLESSARYTSTLQTGSKPSPGCHCGAMFTGGQESVLHSRVSVVLPHSTPPLDGGTKMDRVRLEIPPSQLSVQSPQSSHPVMLQSTGHGSLLHGNVSVVCPHSGPPDVIVRVRTFTPSPQLWLHSPSTHSVISQTGGQACVLHACVSTL